MKPAVYIYMDSKGKVYVQTRKPVFDWKETPLYSAHEIAKFVVTLSHDIVGKPATTEQLVIEATYLDIADRIEQESKKDF